uniref:CDGSH iron-sulfur domain-containing protein 2 homologue n=1 Tax=Mesocestoides corti TaxID=53468 RepID=A0A5K3EU81_MESCO
MNILSNTVRVHLPNTLRDVPIPDSLSGFFSLSLKEMFGLTIFGGVSAALGYSVFFTVRSFLSSGHLNTMVKKNQEKVVDFVDIESIHEKKVFCRCWKSKKFPLCDGAHNKHNQETGDNVGPLIIEVKKNK